jgi:hypothetical protein
MLERKKELRALYPPSPLFRSPLLPFFCISHSHSPFLIIPDSSAPNAGEFKSTLPGPPYPLPPLPYEDGVIAPYEGVVTKRGGGGEGAHLLPLKRIQA